MGSFISKDNDLQQFDITEYPQVISKLKLKEYYCKKLTREKALAVSKNDISVEDLKDPGKIPWFILQNLITLNYDIRCFKVKQIRELNNPLLVFQNPDSDDSDQISPADALIALFWCSDDFLRQLLVEKLAMCQLAIPLILPPSEKHRKSEFLLWAIRTLKKEWKTSSGSSYEVFLATHALPIISAIRLGRPKISKSAILNKIITDQTHNIFFQRECSGGTLKRHISDGLLEITWYLPNGNKKSVFSEALAFMNLRGNAIQLKAQTSFISQISLTTIVFMASDFKQEYTPFLESLYKQKGHLILVVAGIPEQGLNNLFVSLERIKRNGKKVTYILFSNQSESELSEEIKCHLNSILKKDWRKAVSDSSIEMLINFTKEMHFYIDEKQPECSEAKMEAEKMFKSLKRHGKDKMLPLQRIARKIGEQNKELYQLKHWKGNIQIEQYREQISYHIESLRNNQREIWNKGEGILELFKGSFTYSSLKRFFFYIYVKIMTEQSSIGAMQGVRLKYIQKWDELSNDKQKNDKLQKLRRAKLNELERQLYDLSMGLEHVNREIGQVYEMESSILEELPKSTLQFPVIAAEMLLNGLPLELLDGDAFDIPLIWIEAVLSSLQNKIGNRRMFVLSVLGMQSSGKSTMLNAMFGLQLATSAGRCTKGVFAQLLPLAKSVHQSTGYDYIMVVDTEGLGAAELERIGRNTRDNELATLAVGLSDVTIINIMGENETKMRDILQITVHAFMKMKNVKIKPSCIFVHQNITDVLASEKNATLIRNVKEMLDKLTKAAAKVEGCSEKYKQFIDVIHMQDKHTIYVPSLWEGVPPMAPPNPGYSAALLQVKHQVFELMTNSNGKTVGDFKCRLSDLWKAILCEEFVFSFKNTMEIQAYNALEKQFVEHSYTLTNDAATYIENLEKQCKYIAATDMEEAGKCIFEDQVKKLEESIKDFHKTMKDICAKEPQALQNRIELKGNELCEDKRKEINQKFMFLKNGKKEKAAIDDVIIQFELFQKVKSLADKVYPLNATDSGLESRFDTQWQEWKADILQLDLNINTNSVHWMDTKNEFCDMFFVQCKSAEISVKAALLVSRNLQGAISKCLLDLCKKELIESFSNFISRDKSFDSKMSFHAQMLIALKKEDNFQSYKEYLENPNQCMITYMGKCIRKYVCEKPREKSKSILEEYYFDRMKVLFDKAEKTIHKTYTHKKGKCHLSEWWAEFRKNICNELDVKQELKFFGENETFEVQPFNETLRKELNEFKDKLISTFKLDDILSLILEPCTQHFTKGLLGCPDLCPFCKAPCDRSSSLSKYHRTEFHRPQGVAGCLKNNKLRIDVCTTCVMSSKARFRNAETNGKWHLYKEYRLVNNVYWAWIIQPGDSQRYWKWFMAKYNTELAKYYKCRKAAIPLRWKIMTWKSAKEDLKKTIKINS